MLFVSRFDIDQKQDYSKMIFDFSDKLVDFRIKCIANHKSRISVMDTEHEIRSLNVCNWQSLFPVFFLITILVNFTKEILNNCIFAHLHVV